jgi:Hemerythrin HHE cation binding domain
MEIKRYNSFYLIHKALRAMMYDAAIAIQETDFTKPDEAKQALNKIRSVIITFDEHADHEDEFVMPAIEKFDAKTVKEFEDEHVTDRNLGKDIMDEITNYNSAKSDDERKESWLKIFYLFNEFMGFNLYHMNKEEDILNKILWTNLTDGEILEIEGRLVKSIPPEKMMVSIEWMMRGCSNNDIIGFLIPVKSVLPEEAFKGILSIANNILPSERFNFISAALKS